MNRTRPIRLLCTGDLHLGRYPTRVRKDVEVHSVSATWKRMVDYATDQRLDAVVLTGDVVDESNKHFEAYGPLKTGLQSLAEADIPVFAVAGNHDYDVLPRLHRELGQDAFRLLGADGAWETAALGRDDEPIVYFCGWSFDRSHVTESPLASFECPVFESRSDVPVFGVLHADVDGTERRYAPVRLAELNDIPVSAWLLGHIHKPSRFAHRQGFVLYPGSPQPLGTGETGVHGPWMVEIAPSGEVSATQLPMASLAYESIEIDLGGLISENDFSSRVLTRVDEEAALLAEQRPDLKSVLFNVRYTGRTSLHGRVRELDEQVRSEIPASGLNARIVDAAIAVRPDIDLSTLAEGRDPIGVLARVVRDIDAGAASNEGSNETVKFLKEVRQKAGDLHRKPAFSPLRGQREGYDAPTEESLAPIVREQALRLIEEMLNQKPSDGHS